jgi:dipeptidyl aminopeptidase/acylaminoacyl peptidase
LPLSTAHKEANALVCARHTEVIPLEAGPTRSGGVSGMKADSGDRQMMNRQTIVGSLSKTSLVVFSACLALLIEPGMPTAQAQYFGQNKVEYRTFDFSVLKTDHFDIYYYRNEEAAARQAARMAERWYVRLSNLLNHELQGRQPLILYASHPDFVQTTAISGQIGEGTGGVTEALKRRIVLPLPGPLAEADHVIGHELVHAFQYDITGGSGPLSGAPGATQLPLWFIEGMAEYLSLGPVDPNTAMWMRDAALNGKFPSVKDLENPRFFPYRFGQAFWAYVGGRWGDQVIGKIMNDAAQSRDPYSVLTQVLQTPVDSLSADWKAATLSDFEPLTTVTDSASAYGRSLFVHREDHDYYNLAPALSPNGHRLVFLSERGQFSMDMYLANTETGEIERKIVSTALDPHYESLEFINSAGAWDPEGQRFAFAAISGGQPVVEILNVESGEVEREIKVAAVKEIFSPTWSPDGERIAFSANAGGWLDLYVLDLGSGKLDRLTDDAYADLQPAWSPDGRRIAFSTDRFRTDLSNLTYDGYGLALLEVQSGAIERLPTFGGAKNIDPQWSPDGASLYFISDRTGISDLYRLELPKTPPPRIARLVAATSGDREADDTLSRPYQITRLLTGVSGITSLSPALSVARTTGQVAYSVYEHGGYDLYTVDSRARLEAQPATSQVAALRPDILPPADRSDGWVREALLEPDRTLLDTLTVTSRPYSPRLSLDYVAPPTFALGTSQFGTFISGGSALYFSDMLGRRNLTTALQVNGDFKDIAALVGYSNLRTRWNWGVSASQIPYLTGAFASGLADQDGQLVRVDQTYLFRETDRQVGLMVQYPFNRARRLELSGAYSNIGFSAELKTQTIDSYGRLVKETKQDLPSPSALNLGTAGAALVYDNTIFGYTAPLAGQRYRVELSPMFGTLNLANTLVDYRRYLRVVGNSTLAGRLMSYARWGGDAEDERLVPLFIGYQPLVRGYNTSSFSASECRATAASSCPAFDQLFGSRVLIGNLELRVPLVGPLGLIRSRGLPPLDVAGFFDAGSAWWGTSGPMPSRGISRLNTSPDNPVTSYGAALRMNAFGVAVLEFDFVHPNDRPDKGWYFEFGFTPGF